MKVDKKKKASIIVDHTKYIYTVRKNRSDIKIIVYPSFEKIPYVTAYFSYAEAWGFDVDRPKTIEILIKYYNENRHILTKNEWKTLEHPVLFQSLLDYFFRNSSLEEREQFVNIVVGQIPAGQLQQILNALSFGEWKNGSDRDRFRNNKYPCLCIQGRKGRIDTQ